MTKPDELYSYKIELITTFIKIKRCFNNPSNIVSPTKEYNLINLLGNSIGKSRSITIRAKINAVLTEQAIMHN